MKRVFLFSVSGPGGIAIRFGHFSECGFTKNVRTWVFVFRRVKQTCELGDGWLYLRLVVGGCAMRVDTNCA